MTPSALPESVRCRTRASRRPGRGRTSRKTRRGGKRLFVRVVLRHAVVERLPGERDPVFRRAQLFAELHHVLVGLEVWIAFRQREQPSDGSRERPFGHRQALDGVGVAGVLRGFLETADRLVPCLDDRLKRLALVLHVAFGDLDQIGDEIVPPLELYFDLGEGVLVAVPERDEPVVDAHHERGQHDGDQDKCDERDHNGRHGEPPVYASGRLHALGVEFKHVVHHAALVSRDQGAW